jgi:hypothetical protein
MNGIICAPAILVITAHGGTTRGCLGTGSGSTGEGIRLWTAWLTFEVAWEVAPLGSPTATLPALLGTDT